ncbi:hypothetical protein N8E89_28790 (plasmid) [Phyllobacterium sp. A18/5-2]|uniref:hypothetical protein n=1 Tax=Phyllobacterium sp. A18/5-2 TaxID=2978392 RepID=UPI0021CAA21F|nr:hypothetical protein [Phyllobacterium sp. A18/5-2]UXN67496.1 hypothetical protein N8E89_28790 [Phyllobacterium sp. A18/5-2]
MCNLYNATTTHEAMRQLFLPVHYLTNRLTPQIDIYPDYHAPIGRRTLMVNASWQWLNIL